MFSVTFPVENMDWGKLIKHRNQLIALQSSIPHKPDAQDALDTAIAVIEKLMEYRESNFNKASENLNEKN